MESGVSRSDKQHILRPSTPENGRHNVRGATGRFEKLSTEEKQRGRKHCEKATKFRQPNENSAMKTVAKKVNHLQNVPSQDIYFFFVFTG